MTTRERYTAEYLYPGSFFPEGVGRNLPEPTFEAAVKAAPQDTGGFFVKDGWYAVIIRTMVEKHYVADDGDEVWVREGEPGLRSFIVGRLVHIDDPELQGAKHEILRSNIRSNSREPRRGYAVLTRCGNWQMACDYDEVVEL